MIGDTDDRYASESVAARSGPAAKMGRFRRSLPPLRVPAARFSANRLKTFGMSRTTGRPHRVEGWGAETIRRDHGGAATPA